LLLAKETKDREEAEKKKKELEEQMNRYSTQYETTQQGSPHTHLCVLFHTSVFFRKVFFFIYFFQLKHNNLITYTFELRQCQRCNVAIGGTAVRGVVL